MNLKEVHFGDHYEPKDGDYIVVCIGEKRIPLVVHEAKTAEDFSGGCEMCPLHGVVPAYPRYGPNSCGWLCFDSYYLTNMEDDIG